MHNLIYVETGLNIEDIAESHTQMVNDAIKIGVKLTDDIKAEDCHFLQFITRQAPSMFEFINNNTVTWDTADTYYINSPSIIKWRTDTMKTQNSPFYENGGAHVFSKDECSMVDQPGYAFDDADGVNERINGCTFVIIKGEVIGEVRWSRQYELQDDGQTCVSTYRHKIVPTTQLPEWAIHTVRDDAYGTNDGKYADDKCYDLPGCLDRELTMEPQVAQKLAINSFLKPPEKWVLYHNPPFKTLANQMKAVHNISTSHSHGLFCTSPNAESNAWNDIKVQNDNISDKSGPGYGF